MSGLQIVWHAAGFLTGLLIGYPLGAWLTRIRRDRDRMANYARWMVDHGVELPSDLSKLQVTLKATTPDWSGLRTPPTPPMRDCYVTVEKDFRPPSAGLNEGGP